MNAGYIYILVNPSLQKDMLKIGMTRRSPEVRAKELSGSTGIPSDFLVAYEEQIPNCALAEKLLHEKLDNFRIRDNREFFQLPLKDAIREVSEIADQIKISSPFSPIEPAASFASKVAIFDGHTHTIMSLAFSPNSKQILSGAENARVILHNIQSGEVIHNLHMHMGWVYCADFSPNGQLMLAGRTTNTNEWSGFYDKTVYMWELNSGKLIHRFEHPYAAFSLSFSPDGDKVYSGSYAGNIDKRTIVGKIYILDANSGGVIGSFDGHTHFVRAIAVSNNGKFLASGSWDKTVRVWDLNRQIELGRHENHNDQIRSVTFSPDSNLIISGGFDNKIVIWNWAKNEAFTLGGHTDYVRTVTVTPDGRFVISGGDDGYIRFWNISSGIEIGRIERPEDHLNNLALSKDGRYLASGDKSGLVHLWELNLY